MSRSDMIKIYVKSRWNVEDNFESSFFCLKNKYVDIDFLFLDDVLLVKAHDVSYLYCKVSSFPGAVALLETYCY